LPRQNIRRLLEKGAIERLLASRLLLAVASVEDRFRRAFDEEDLPGSYATSP
jgi:hypothetical protein